jgi:hypothetical protein
MCTLHPFTTQYMRAPCHERCITKMISKQLTSLNILGLYLHLGSAEGYYNLTSQFPTCVENYAVIKVQHCVQSVILLLCVPHHIAGVAFRASSIANSLHCAGTIVSKSIKKDSKGFRPSKVGKLLVVVPIQRNSLVSRAHLLVDTSYIWFCQFSGASFESDEHTLSLHQLRFPSTVGLI